MKQALEGLNVVEFSANLGAACAAMALAEHGARTIKVEPPAGAPGRGTPHFHVLNRGKRSLFLDLSAAAASADRDRLIRWADIVVVGATPARLKADGLDYASIRDLNPRAVVLHIPPLGSRGPEAELDLSDDMVAALSGIMGSQWAHSGNPVALHFPASSYSAGTLGAAAAIAAIAARDANGRGQMVEVSLLAGAFSLQTGGIMRHEKMTRMYEGPADPLGPIPAYRLFRASDGEYLFAACGNMTFWNKFALALDRPGLVADERFEGAPWGVSSEHRETLKETIQEIIATRPRDEWLKILRENDVPSAPVLSRQTFIADAQVGALAMRREVADPVLGSTVQLGVSITLNDTPGEIPGPAPALVRDPVVAQWLSEPTHDHAAAATTGAAPAATLKRPLEGVLVLDFCSYIAGSYGPMILAQMGAEVIKIESLEGDAFRNFGFGFLGWNQGKRGLSLDLAAPDAREIIDALARRADVIVENLRPGRMRRFGFDYARLATLNPRLVYMSVNGFGNRGPDHNQPGFDPLLQARSGVMAAEGGHNHPPLYLTCAICDYGAAMLSALGCVLALHARRQTGRGQLCETSLLQSAMAFQAGEFIFYDGRPDMENGAPESRGYSALCRAYQCRGGDWLYVDATTPSHWEAMREMAPPANAPDFAAAAAQPAEGPLAVILADSFARLDRAEALAALAHAGVPAIRINHFADLFNDPQVAANGLIAELRHSQWGKLLQTGVLAQFSETPTAVDHAAPLLGEHSDEILREYLGYDARRIAGLRERRVLK